MKKVKNVINRWFNSNSMTPTCMIPVRKAFIAMSMMLGLSTNVNASTIDDAEFKVENVEMYRFDIHHKKLEKTLECASDQIDFVDYAIDEFEKDMLFAATVADSSSRNAVVKNAVDKNLRLMGMVLDKRQYRKYLTLINVTLINRGFNVK